MIVENNNVQMNDICYLVPVIKSFDDIGNNILTDGTPKQVFCGELGIQRSEFYSAAQVDIKPEKLLVINGMDYEDEIKVIFDNKKYDVFRVFPRTGELIELYLTRSA